MNKGLLNIKYRLSLNNAIHRFMLGIGLKSMQKNKIFLFIALLFLLGCKEDIDVSSRYVFRDETVASYLLNHEVYSEYCSLLHKVCISELSDSKLIQLLSARGHYTIFAPTNDAVHAYLGQLVENGMIPTPSWEAFPDSATLDSIRKVIVYNSIIDGGDTDIYYTYDFPQQSNGEFNRGNLKDKRLTVRYTNNVDDIFINKDCPINVRNRDIPATNGVIHQVEKVIAPDELSMAEMLKCYIRGERKGFRVMARLCEACGLLDTLSKIRDDKYERLYNTGRIQPTWPANGMISVRPGRSFTPPHRKYGFTIFAEPDSFWENIFSKPSEEISLSEIQDWISSQGFYPEYRATENYKDNKNLLYQWTTYHVLDTKIAPNRLTFHFCEFGYNYMYSNSSYTIPVMEYYVTMGKRRLLKIYESPESNGIYLNRFPIIDNRREGTGHEVGCDEDKTGNYIDKDDETLANHSAVNGYMYAIDKPLAYSNDVRHNLGKQRIRMDAMSWFPEAMNTDIRCQMVDDDEHGWVHIPYDSEYKYFDNLSINEGSTFVYCNGYGKGWSCYCCDEIKCVGRWELTFKLPPVPERGMYEIRYRVYSNEYRGMAQVYFGTDPDKLPVAGIPLDLRMGGADPRTGWLPDTDDQIYNSEIDKAMHTKGFMKGEKSTDCLDVGGANSRSNIMNNIVRHVIVKQMMDPDETYYIKLKSVLDKETTEFHMDGLEWCPKEVYDNPNEPEDIW